jgi:hypothetical protein
MVRCGNGLAAGACNEHDRTGIIARFGFSACAVDFILAQDFSRRMQNSTSQTDFPTVESCGFGR